MKHFKIEVEFYRGKVMLYIIEAETKQAALSKINKMLRKETFRVVKIKEGS